ncbi:MAG: signal recognition particle-docking protein FtsY [Proteobacteria bacterium]|nr:signal recognition particle-docking protein FtsY [Pseudomonadota bacterium]
MFSFFKKRPPAADTPEAAPPADVPAALSPAEPERRGWLDRLRDATGFGSGSAADEDVVAAPEPAWPAPPPLSADTAPTTIAPPVPAVAPRPAPIPAPPPVPLTLPPTPQRAIVRPAPIPAPPPPAPEPAPAVEEHRGRWLARLRGGLRKTGSSITQVFTGTRIDDALYEELEAALLMADAGVKATEFLLVDLKRRVKDAKATEPSAVKGLLADAIADLLKPLERGLEVGRHMPTVLMVVGVNGAGKTTSIGKLTRYLADHGQKVLLAAADTFRAAAREQLAVWAQRADTDAPTLRDAVEIVSQEGGDPAAVTFDAVVAGKARGCDVVIADTAGRLTTQLHLMEELKKIKRVIGKAQDGAPHEVLLVVDGNTGQNALSQVQLFDAALDLTGLVITKLDGTAKGGVLAAIALWSRERGTALPVYFVGVGEKLEDLQTFGAREFAQALLG